MASYSVRWNRVPSSAENKFSDRRLSRFLLNQRSDCPLHTKNMQSVLVYGRQFARCVMGYLPYDASANVELPGRHTARRRMRLVTASCGFSKDSAANNNRPGQVFKKDIFGDDACFVAKYKNYDVLGKMNNWHFLWIAYTFTNYSLVLFLNHGGN